MNKLDTLIKKAKNHRDKRIKQLKKRARLLPCLEQYDALVIKFRNDGLPEPECLAMNYLTDIFRGTHGIVLKQIDQSGKSGIQAINAIKRSAGTNFQGLCEYSILCWLESTGLPIVVGPNAPKSMKDELTIFGVDSDGGDFSVEPDIDICLWVDDKSLDSPIIFLSAKTSLVDRAGQAARWKLYLDLHQTSCTHTKEVFDCPINRTRIKIPTKHPITHCIVTANIYKIDTTQPYGELTSGQCRNNTYMFKHKYTTRNDSQEIRPSGWDSFSGFPGLVKMVLGSYIEDEYTKTDGISMRLTGTN